MIISSKVHSALTSHIHLISFHGLVQQYSPLRIIAT